MAVDSVEAKHMLSTFGHVLHKTLEFAYIFVLFGTTFSVGANILQCAEFRANRFYVVRF